MIWVRIVLTTHPSLVTIPTEPKGNGTQRYTVVVVLVLVVLVVLLLVVLVVLVVLVATIEGRRLEAAMKIASSGRSLDSNFGNYANLEMLSLDFFVQALRMRRSKKSSGVYRLKYKRNRTSRLSRSASIRVHVEVQNG